MPVPILSRKIIVVVVCVVVALLVAAGFVFFKSNDEESRQARAGVAEVPPDFFTAIEGMRDAVLEFNGLHGYLPDIVASPDWVEMDGGRYRASKERFVEATEGGKLAIAVVSDRDGTVRLIGVFSGGLMDDPAFRNGLVRRMEASSPDLRLYAVDATPYRPNGLTVYIGLD